MASLFSACGDNALAPDGPDGPGNEANPAGSFEAGRATREYPGPCVEITDQRMDGRPEVITEHSYDQENRRTSLTHDTFGDGFIDYAQTFEYSTDGRRRVEEIDSHGNGITDIRTTIEFDDHGNEVSWSYDKGADGSIEQLRRSHYVSGFLVERVSTRLDDPERRSEYTRDPLGRATLELHYLGTTISRRIERDFDGERLLSEKTDADGDGQIDGLASYAYDDGQVSVYYDTENDGVFDSSEHEWFDESGLVIRRAFDFDGDAQLDWIEERFYEDGFLSTQEIDENGSGDVDYVVSYQRNQRGQPLRAELDRGLDGVADAVDVRRYDVAGNITSFTRDTDGDGQGDVEYLYRYTCFR